KGYVGNRVANSPINDLPSWVPDWSIRLLHSPFYTTESNHRFCASSNFRYQPEPVSSFNQLIVRGMIVDTIAVTVQWDNVHTLETDTEFLLFDHHLCKLLMAPMNQQNPSAITRERLFDVLTAGGTCLGDTHIREPGAVHRYSELMHIYDE